MNPPRLRADRFAPAGSTRSDLRQISVIVPTKNESRNVEPLVAALYEALATFDAEVIFVDDSDDDTADAVRGVIDRTDSDRFDVRLIHRSPNARTGGLSGAVLEGLQSARMRWACVMDGDLQHPPSTIPRMLEKAESSGASLVLASRYVQAGSPEGLANRGRRAVSILSGSVAKLAFGPRLSGVSDPMTGFFVVDTAQLDLSRVHPMGFKILLEVLISHPDLHVAEVGFDFGPRENGESKASLGQGIQFARQLIELRRGGSTRLNWRYDIDGIIAVESEQRLPELDKFVCRRPTAANTITVRVTDLGHLPIGESIDTTEFSPVVSYRERGGFAMSLRLGVLGTEVMVSKFVAKSPHVLYTNVIEPILRWRLVELGYVLVHAACFADGEDAYLVTARTDTGKTTTMLKVLKQSELSFVSDDLVVLSSDGTVRTFPKPLTISAHTVHALHNTDLNRFERIALFPQSRIHSRQGRLIAFLLTRFRLPVASINAIVQRVVPPPKYHVERLVRGVNSQSRSTARGMFIIERGGSGDMAISSERALQILQANCDDAFGFPPYSSLERLLLASSEHDLKAKERAIIETAISSLPVIVMRSETMDWAERIPASVLAWRTIDQVPEEPYALATLRSA